MALDDLFLGFSEMSNTLIIHCSVCAEEVSHTWTLLSVSIPFLEPLEYDVMLTSITDDIT